MCVLCLALANGGHTSDAVSVLGRSYFSYYNSSLTFQVHAALAACLSPIPIPSSMHPLLHM